MCITGFAGTHALGGERHDREAVRAWFERLFLLYPELTFEVSRVTCTGWPWALQATGEWVALATPLHGRAYRNQGAHVIRLRGTRVTHLHAYEDSQAVAQALQIMAQAGIAEAEAAPITS
ncbi:MAG: nuclear transport factor 2 family protein [Actinomycetota bacterium]|nr:nuclear transport factor 2 family protein [Actinomycetota bacterium]